MSNTKHTPGPWRVHRYDKTRLAITSDAGEIIIMPNFAADTEEGQANAQLIASAPELLKALKALEQDTREHGYVPPSQYDAARLIERIEGKEAANG